MWVRIIVYYEFCVELIVHTRNSHDRLFMFHIHHTVNLLMYFSCVPDAGVDGCKIQACHSLYRDSELALGVEVGELQYQAQTSPEVREIVCVILRTYSKCLNATSGKCHSNLAYHSMHSGATEKLRRNQCSAEGKIFDPSSYPHPPPKHDPCAYRDGGGGGTVVTDESSDSSTDSSSTGSDSSSQTVYRMCGLFGDPHLRTFNNEFQTCRVKGAWSMVDNDWLTVQVTNQPVGEWAKVATATATSKVIVYFLSIHLQLRIQFIKEKKTNMSTSIKKKKSKSVKMNTCTKLSALHIPNLQLHTRQPTLPYKLKIYSNYITD